MKDENINRKPYPAKLKLQVSAQKKVEATAELKFIRFPAA